MKKTPLILLIQLIIFFIIVNISYSQDREPPHRMKEEPPQMKNPEASARDITDKLHDMLSLNDGQDSLVYQAYQSYFNTISMFKNVKGKDDEAEKIMKDSKTELNTKMKNILTGEQFDKYKSYQQEMEAKRDEMKKGPPPPHR
jgi:hypothetical protein